MLATPAMPANNPRVASTWLPAGCFLATFIVYVLTLSPSVSFTDSGELTGVCQTLGVAHPTGYPFYTWLGYLFLRLPLPFSPVYRLNLFAALCTSASTVPFYYVTRILLAHCRAPSTVKIPVKHRKQKPSESPLPHTLHTNNLSSNGELMIATAATLTYGFARTVWQQANHVEVYSLHLFMLCLNVWLFLHATDEDTLYNTKSDTQEPAQSNNSANRMWMYFALGLGLSFGNHLTTILLAPGMLFLFFRRRGLTRESMRLISWMVPPFLLGLSLYLYLPLRSGAHFPFASLGPPAFNWGGVDRGLDKFLYHVTGRQFQVWMFTGEWREQLHTFFALFPYQLGALGFVPMALGALTLFKHSRDHFWFLVLLLLGCVAYAVNYSIHDIDSYFLLAYLSSLWLCAAGLPPLLRRARGLIACAFLLPLLNLALNYEKCDRSRDYLVLDYTRNLVDHLQPNAVILSSQWDYFCSAFLYLQRVEGLRPDVTLIEKELLRRTWYVEQLPRAAPEVAALAATEIAAYQRDLERFESDQPYDRDHIQAAFLALLNAIVDRSADHRPVYVTFDVLSSEPGVARAYQKIPAGLAVRLLPPGAPLPPLDEHLALDRLAATRIDDDDHLEAGIHALAAQGVASMARFAAALQRPADASRLEALSRALGRPSIH